MGWGDFQRGWDRIRRGDVSRQDWWNAVEQTQRDLTPGEWADDFQVGLGRIFTGRVGKDGNPTLGRAWFETDETFSGFLPGGADPELPDVLKDFSSKLLVPAAIIAAALFFASRRK